MLCYDLEIEKAILQENVGRQKKIKYCEGWKDHRGMGISVLCAYDFNADTFHVFLKDNLPDFQALVKQHTQIVGFNSESFDDIVCFENGINVKTTFDLLRETYKAIGLDPYPGYYTEEYKGYGLDALCQATLGFGKTGNGAHAPIDWQQGKLGKVINYCLHDVKLTKLLMQRVLDGKPFIDPHTTQEIFLDFDSYLKGVVK